MLLAASRNLHVGVTVRRGARVLARRGFAATQHARYVTLRLSDRRLRELARRRATTLTVEISAAGAPTVRRRVVVVRAASRAVAEPLAVQHHIQDERPGRDRP